jgi:anti-sigma factor RsiW
MEQMPPAYATAASADHLTCQQATALLTAYVDNALAPETLHAFQQHMQDCADCLAYLQTYRATIRALGTLRYEDIPAVLQERLRSFLHRQVTRMSPSALSGETR